MFSRIWKPDKILALIFEIALLRQGDIPSWDHCMVLSLRQLKRMLKHRGLGRRTNRSELEVVWEVTEQEKWQRTYDWICTKMTQRLTRSWYINRQVDC